MLDFLRTPEKEEEEEEEEEEDEEVAANNTADQGCKVEPETGVEVTQSESRKGNGEEEEEKAEKIRENLKQVKNYVKVPFRFFG